MQFFGLVLRTGFTKRSPRQNDREALFRGPRTLRELFKPLRRFANVGSWSLESGEIIGVSLADAIRLHGIGLILRTIEALIETEMSLFLLAAWARRARNLLISGFSNVCYAAQKIKL
jgi:hypothetical protein